MLDEGLLEQARAERYAGWQRPEAKAMLETGTLDGISEQVLKNGIDPQPRSGRQERLENLVNRYL
jgi:xylose isomerase